ncbi:uncharacterized protein F5147DRAFT_657592 [Suillus discolor]|uniref:Protein kinase domain-containing protein n=1 Tax=Suillus discolor TaxID=1912936 RepID=A0A9P7EWT9_9AGAM|nr:uncharacterized protein F5147DRAFT_657592 [Suillus discolor]KAG2092814.1 hypothetical protein F5147DRAFT_657592 [Suillus discolor]
MDQHHEMILMKDEEAMLHYCAWRKTGVLLEKWVKSQPETETSSSTYLDVDVSDNGCPVDLTTKVGKELTYPLTQGGCGDVWKLAKGQPETEMSSSMHLDIDISDNGRPVDLTTKIVKDLTYATAQGSFGDVWKCIFSEKDNNVEVAIKCVRIEIQNDSFKKIVNERLMDDFCKWKPLLRQTVVCD